jgi:hypothetical protein
VLQGLSGGTQANTLLKQAVEQDLNALMPEVAHHLKVVTRVYANLKGLAKVYKDAHIGTDHVLDEFVRGFNMADAMCDFVDAGNGKECSDEKVKGMYTSRLPGRKSHD